MTSIGTSKINIALGTPLGAKNPRNFNKPCLAIAIKVTSMKIKNDIASNYYMTSPYGYMGAFRVSFPTK